MAEYIKSEVVETLSFVKRDEWRQHWIEYLEKFRGTVEYSTAEQAVDNWLRGYGEAVDDFLAICDSQPTAEVVEVRHGEWLHQKLCGEDIVDCSECKTLGSPQWKWCPVCGAKMDGKDGAE